jgi:hypothetical protein
LGTPSHAPPDVDPNAALIGGIVGGILGLFLIIGIVIATVVICRRRTPHQQSATDGPAPNNRNVNMYQRAPQRENNYDEPDVVRQN